MDLFLKVYQKFLFQTFFQGQFLSTLSDHKDLNMLLNFWVNEQDFMIHFQNLNNIGAQNDLKLKLKMTKR